MQLLTLFIFLLKSAMHKHNAQFFLWTTWPFTLRYMPLGCGPAAAPVEAMIVRILDLHHTTRCTDYWVW